MFSALLALASGSARALGLEAAEVLPAKVAETWSWSGTESETESESDGESPDAGVCPGDAGDDGGGDGGAAGGADSAEKASKPAAVTVVLGWHKRDEDKEAIVLHMCAHCPALRLVRKVDMGALYTLRTYAFVPGAAPTPHPVDLYRAACLACLE